jgi:hypothetical protein
MIDINHTNAWAGYNVDSTLRGVDYFCAGE